MCRSLIAALLLLVLAGCTLSSTNELPLATPDIPRVEILFPENNQQIVEGFDTPLDVYAQDETSGIARIELFVDGELLRSMSPQGAAPTLSDFRVETNWLAEGVGRHVISAIAYRLDGTESSEVAVIVEVIPR